MPTEGESRVLPPRVVNRILELFRKVDECALLTPALRNVLKSVLQHLRNAPVIDVLEELSDPEWLLLSKICFNATVEARNRGGPCIALIPEESLPLLEKLGMLVGGAPEEPITRRERTDDLREAVLRRQEKHCLISAHTDSTHGGHIIPQTLAGLSSPYSSCFWSLLALIIGKAHCERVWELVGADRCDVAENGILLDSYWHSLWDKGSYNLVAMADSDPSFLDIKLKVRDASAWKLKYTPLQENPEDQRIDSYGPPREVVGGNIFRLFAHSNDSLPSQLLLEARAVLVDVVDAGGMQETNKEKAEKMPPKRSRKSPSSDTGNNTGRKKRAREGSGTSGRGQARGRAAEGKKAGGRRGSRGGRSGKTVDAELSTADKYLATTAGLLGTNQELRVELSVLYGSAQEREETYRSAVQRERDQAADSYLAQVRESFGTNVELMNAVEWRRIPVRENPAAQQEEGEEGAEDVEEEECVEEENREEGIEEGEEGNWEGDEEEENEGSEVGSGYPGRSGTDTPRSGRGGVF